MRFLSNLPKNVAHDIHTTLPIQLPIALTTNTIISGILQSITFEGGFGGC